MHLGYWLIWLFGFLIALQPLNLGTVVAPLNSLLTEIGAFLPNLIGALAIFIVGLALSKIARGITENAIGMFNVDRFLSDGDAASGEVEQTGVRTSIASAAGIAVRDRDRRHRLWRAARLGGNRRGDRLRPWRTSDRA